MIKKKNLFFICLILVAVFLLPCSVLADDEEAYRQRIQHDYKSDNGTALYFSDLCIMDDDGYAIFGIQGEIDETSPEIVVLRYDSKYNLVYKQSFMAEGLGEASILTGKLIPLPNNRVIVAFPKKAFLLENDGKLLKTVDLPLGEINPVVRLGDTLVSVTTSMIYQYDLDLNVIKTKPISLDDNQIMMFSNIDHEASFVHGQTLYNLDANLNYHAIHNFPENSGFAPLVKLKGQKYIGLTMDEDNKGYYIITEDLQNFALKHPDYAASSYLAMGHMFFGILARVKYAEELDNGYVFTNQILSEDNQTCTISISVYDLNYNLIYEKEIATIPAFGSNQSQTNAATILNSVARLRNGDFVMLYTTGHVAEDLEAHDIVFTYKRKVMTAESSDSVYFDNDYFKPGEKVQMRFKSNPGYSVSSVTITDTANNTVQYNKKDYTFVMPDDDVVVDVQWKAITNPDTGTIISLVLCIVAILMVFYPNLFKLGKKLKTVSK